MSASGTFRTSHLHAVAIAAIGPQALADAVRTGIAPLVSAARTFDPSVTQLVISLGILGG